jgi:hypothetical protein
MIWRDRFYCVGTLVPRILFPATAQILRAWKFDGRNIVSRAMVVKY